MTCEICGRDVTLMGNGVCGLCSIAEQAKLKEDDRTPEGYKEIENARVFKKPNSPEIIIIGEPTEEKKDDGDPIHNCDEQGCGRFDHKLYEAVEKSRARKFKSDEQ